MIVMRHTQKLLKDMKIDPVEVDIVAPLSSWHCNILILNRKKHILFVNDLSRLSLIIDGVRSSQPKVLKEKFLSELNTYLVQEGNEQRMIDSYIRDGQELVIILLILVLIVSILYNFQLSKYKDIQENAYRLKLNHGIGIGIKESIQNLDFVIKSLKDNSPKETILYTLGNLSTTLKVTID